MQNIPIHLLNAFVIFNGSQNITEAASILGITQPALSKQLKTLERLSPQPLFIFSGRRKILTPFGRGLHERVKRRIGNLQEVVRETYNIYAEPKRASLRIAARRGVLDRISEKSKFPGTLSFLESTSDQVIQDLLNLKADIGVTYRIIETHELIAKPLFQENFQIVIPKQFVLRKRNYGKALFYELGKHSYIGYSQNDEILNRLCTLNSLNPAEIKMTRVTSNYSSIVKMVNANLGWAIVPSYLEVDEHKSWTVQIPSLTIPIREFFLVYRTELAAVPWVKELILEIKNCFKE